MKKLTSHIAVCLASFGLIATPIAAQANTRAGDNSTVYSQSTVSKPGTARNAEGEDLFGEGKILIALIALLFTTGGVIILLDDDDDQSPGT